MEKDKIIDIIDNINIQDGGINYNNVRLEIFKEYIKDFVYRVNMECKAIGKIAYEDVVGIETLNIPDNTQKYNLRFEHCIKIGYSKYISLHLNEKSLSKMVELFENHKEYIREEALKLVAIMDNNWDNSIKILSKLPGMLKNSNACQWTHSQWEMKECRYQSGRASLIQPIRLRMVGADEIEIPLYKPYTEEQLKAEVDKIENISNKSITKSILDRYTRDEKKYDKEKFKYTYDLWGQRTCTPNPTAIPPKLSLTEKYILVDYVIQNNDFVLAKRMYTKRSNLPQHLKEKLTAVVLMEKLVKSV